jgi:drug/metabolite transporter (DMT)-like permease
MHSQQGQAGAGRHRLGVAIVLLSTIVWASAGLFVRLLPFDIWSIIVYRNLFAVVFVGAYVIWRFGNRTLAVIRGMGLPGAGATLCMAATVISFPAAFQHTSVGNVVTIYAAIPFVTAALAWAWYCERPSPATLAAGAVALVGIAIMEGPTASGPNFGDLLALQSTLQMALLTLIIRRYAHVEMLPVALLAIIVSGLVAYPLAHQLADFGPRDIVVAAGFALFPITLGMMLYVIGSAMVPATLAALIQTLESPFGMLWVWLGVGEVPPVETLIGGAMVVAAVFARLWLDARRAPAPGPA